MLRGELWTTLGKLKEAHECYEAATAVAIEPPGLGVESWADAFITQHASLHAQGKNNDALAGLVPLLERKDLSPDKLALLHRALGNTYRSAANWHKAEHHLSLAVEMAKSHGDQARETEWTAELGRVYRSSGLLQKALTLQKVAYEAAIERGNVAQLAAVCGYIGFTNYSLQPPNHEEAIRYLGVRLLVAEKVLRDEPGVRWCLNNLGKVYHSMGILHPAVQCFRKSLELVKGTGNLLGEGTALGNLGSVLRDSGRYEEAVKYHEQYLLDADKGTRMDLGGKAIMLRELALDHLLMWDAEKTRGGLEKSRMYLEKSRGCAIQGLLTLSQMRSHLDPTDDQLKLGDHEKNQSRLYSILQYSMCELDQYESALLVSEMGRARALCDLMKSRSRVESDFSTQISNLFAENFKQDLVDMLYARLTSLANQLSTSILIYSVVEEPKFTGQTQQRKWLFIWVVGKGGVIHFERKFISYKEIQLVLEEDYRSIMSRDIGLKKEKKIVDAKTSAGEEVQSIPSPTDTTSKSNVCPSPSSKFVPPISSTTSSPTATQPFHWYDVLIAPIKDHIKDPGAIGAATPRLVIIPHNFLFSVPFSALRDPDGNSLVKDFVISYAPSLSILHHLARKSCSMPSEQGGVPFIVGNPVMPLPDILQLPGAEDEAITVHNILNGELCLNEHATKQKVVSSVARRPVIHLATHALLGDSVAEHLEVVMASKEGSSGDYAVRGAVVLAKSSPTCSGILTSREVQELDLSACEMITLSCCRTACGKVTGDGILGLSRALLVAGPTCLVTTLWPIEDRPTVQFMHAFYTHYKGSRDAASSMRNAMLSLIGEGFSLEHWAAFCVSGVSPGMLQQ